jgi:hypothetical protein
MHHLTTALCHDLVVRTDSDDEVSGIVCTALRRLLQGAKYKPCT